MTVKSRYVFAIREAVKNYLADFFPLRGGVPPFPLRVFGQDDFPLREEAGILGSKTPFFAFFHTFLALFGL